MANNEKAPDASGGEVQASKPSPSKSAGNHIYWYWINQQIIAWKYSIATTIPCDWHEFRILLMLAKVIYIQVTWLWLFVFYSVLFRCGSWYW